MITLTETEVALTEEAAEFFETRIEQATDLHFRRALEEAAINWRKVADAAQAHADRNKAVA